ncbi:MAG TPA: PPC domain-containing protein [Gemmatimonadales bacterium]|nr:PPC domain-containing protein [Gemmatimonadales bacterium]
MEPGRGIGTLVVVLALAPGGLAAQEPPVTSAAPRGTMAVGDTVRDSLTRHDPVLPAESTYAQQWRLRGRAGETVTIDLASSAFDAYLFLLGPGVSTAPPQDDDSGGRCNARLTVRLPATGDYFIVATSSERRATGAFTLTVTAGPKAVALAPCTR